MRRPGEIAEAMLELATRDELRVELAAAARRSARSRFQLGRVVGEYEAIYESICGR